MSTKKSDIKGIFRANLPQAFLLIEKPDTAGKLWIVPGRQAAGDSILAEARQLIVDLSIYAHLFINTRTGDSGRVEFISRPGDDFINTLKRSADQAFQQGYKIVVLVLDKQCHTTAAKEYTQRKRAKQALAACIAARCEPVDWDLDNPTPLVVRDQPMLPMVAIKATPAAFRYALWEAMNHVLTDYAPPPGCRLIIDMQAYEATNPETPDDWLASTRVHVPEQHRAFVEKLREGLRTCGPLWRHAARKLSTELGRAGMFNTLPWCVHTTHEGLRLLPYTLPKCSNTWGETDLAAWGWVSRLFADRQVESLQGVRLAHIDNAVVPRSDAELTSDRHGGRSVVATTDSDFFAGAMAAIGLLICDFAHGKPPTYATIDEVGAYCPLVLMGDTYSTTLGYVPHAGVFGVKKEAETPGCRMLHKVFEFVDTHRFFCAALFDRYPVTAIGDDVVKPETLKPLVVDKTTPHQWFRRALTVVTCCIIAGNDYLEGLKGMSHGPIWSALVALTLYNADLVLLTRSFLRPLDKQHGELPSQSAVLINPVNYVQFVKLCQYVSLRAKGGPHAPTCGPSKISYAQMAELVANKWKKCTDWHMADFEKLSLQFDRAQYCLYYILYGPTTVRRTLDETRIAFRPHERDRMV